jgi:hypothetical protein
MNSCAGVPRPADEWIVRHVLDELRECEAAISPGIFDLAQISASVRRSQAMDPGARCELGFPGTRPGSKFAA